MKKLKWLMLILGITLITISAIMWILTPKFDLAKYSDLKNTFNQLKSLQLFCYWNKNDYRINDVFYGEYYDNQGKRHIGFFTDYSDQSKNLNKQEVFQKAGITERDFKILCEKMKSAHVNTIEKTNQFIEFSVGFGILDNYHGFLYSPYNTPKENKHNYYYIKSIGNGWYKYSHT